LSLVQGLAELFFCVQAQSPFALLARLSGFPAACRSGWTFYVGDVVVDVVVVVDFVVVITVTSVAGVGDGAGAEE
jgi:hypothetical protein